MIRLIKGIIQSGKLRNKQKDQADRDQKVSQFEAERNLAVRRFIKYNIPHIMVESPHDHECHYKYNEITDPDHPVSDITDIAPVNVGKPVKKQKKERENIRQDQVDLPFLVKILRKGHKECSGGI